MVDYVRLVRIGVAGAVCIVAVVMSAPLSAKGETVVPVYEGWYQNPDGSFDLVFGYFNRNWDEELDVPVGPQNHIEPGGPDRGQPTHFYPRRSRFMFRVRVPGDFGQGEVIWTLVTQGTAERAYGTLRPEYIIDKGVFQANYGAVIGQYPDNVEPELEIDGHRIRHASVGIPITLTAVATDDGQPKRAPMRAVGSGAIQVPAAAAGLRLSWLVYRGAAAAVTFDPPQFSAWEDYREGRNSPHSPGWVTPPIPAGNQWVTQATFNEPGTYVLRALAHDGGLATTRDITVTVTE